MKGKRILICRSNGPGGVANYYRSLEPWMPDRVTYFLVHDPDEKRMPMKFWKLLLRVPKFIGQSLKCDVVCVNPSLYPKSYYRDMLLLFLAGFLRRKRVVFFRGWSLDFGERIAGSRMRHALFRLTYGRADGLIVLGETFADKLVRMGVPESRIFRTTTVADFPESRLPNKRVFNASVKTLRILFLSRIEDGKGWRQAIDLVFLLKDRLKDWEITLTMGGDGNRLEEARAYAMDRGLECDFPGRVHGREKERLYENSDIYILHSVTEGLPNSILEAMAYGLLIMTTPVGAIPEIVRDGENGIVIRHGIEDAVERLIELLAEPEYVQKIMNRNLKVARKQFLPEHCAARLLEILDNVASGAKHI